MCRATAGGWGGAGPGPKAGAFLGEPPRIKGRRWHMGRYGKTDAPGNGVQRSARTVRSRSSFLNAMDSPPWIVRENGDHFRDEGT